MDDILKAIQEAEKFLQVRVIVPPTLRAQLEDLSRTVQALARENKIEIRVHSVAGADAWVAAYVPNAQVPVWVKSVR